jgi:hypothetical protein
MGGGGGGSLMTYSAGSVTNQSIALKYVMASERIKIYFFETLIALKVKPF